MRLQRFAHRDNWTIVGETVIHKDRFARTYADGVRIALVRSDGPFTTLLRRDGTTIYVMTSDWQVTGRLPSRAD